MSLLQKASIITTPTAYAEDYLYSIKPAYQVSDTELVTNGNFDTDSDWTKGSSWTISGGAAHSDGGTASTLSSTPLPSLVVGKKYKTTYTIKNRVSGSTGINATTSFYGSNNTDVYHSENGTYEVIAVCANASGDIRFYSNNFNGSIDNVSVREVTEADFDFDRNSTGTRVNEDYLIEDVPYNLASYSENISVWDNFRVGVQLSDVLNPFKSGYVYLVEDGTETDNHYRKRPYIFLDSSGTYTQSFFVKKKDDGVYPVLRTSGVGGNSFVTFNWDTETLVQGSDITSSKVEKYNYGWYRISMVFSNLATTDFIIGISNDVNDDLPTYTGSNNGFYVWGCQIVKGDQPKDYLKTTDRLDIPRIDYTNGEPSILLEPSRQNVFPYNIDFSNADWSKQNVSVTANSITSPEGITNATLVTENSSNILHYLSDAVSVTSGTSYTVSVYAKKKERNVLQIILSTNFLAASYANYDLDNGVVSATGGVVTAQMIDMPNDWYRCILTFTATATNSGSPLFALQTSTTASRGAAYQGDGASGLYLYGAQFEVGSYATSLIHTSGSAVTRSADVANNAGNSDLFNDSEGVLYAEIARTSNNATYELLSINSSGTQNIISLGFDSGNNEIWYRAKFNNTDLILAVGAEVRPQNEFFKIAIKYKSGDTKVYLNGNLIDSSTNTATSSDPFLSLDFDFNNIYPFYGNVKSVMVFKEALTDTELEKLTGYNNHELYMNYYNRLSYLGLVEEYNVESDINNYIL